MACLVVPAAAALGRAGNGVEGEGPMVPMVPGSEIVDGDDDDGDDDRRSERGAFVRFGYSAAVAVEGSLVGYIDIVSIAIGLCREDFEFVFVAVEESVPLPVLMPVIVFVSCIAIFVVVGIIGSDAVPARITLTMLTS